MTSLPAFCRVKDSEGHRRPATPKTENAMVLERAEISIKPGMMDEFLEALVNRALPLTETFTGLISFTALRGVEEPDSVMFLAEWETVESHLASRSEPAHAEFRSIVVPFTAGAKQTVHFSPVGTRSGPPGRSSTDQGNQS